MIVTVTKGDPQVPPLLLLHGTGGDEHSLTELAQFLSPTATLIALRGSVNENGANRFFRRYGEGQFDLADLEVRTDKLIDTLKTIQLEYQLDLSEMVIVGYSNGANIGAHLLLERQTPYHLGIFFHGMSLGKHQHQHDLSTTRVWFSAGKQDPIVPFESSSRLVTEFKNRNADVTEFWLPGGHQLVYPELEAAKKWLQEKG